MDAAATRGGRTEATDGGALGAAAAVAAAGRRTPRQPRAELAAVSRPLVAGRSAHSARHLDGRPGRDRLLRPCSSEPDDRLAAALVLSRRRPRSSRLRSARRVRRRVDAPRSCRASRRSAGSVGSRRSSSSARRRPTSRTATSCAGRPPTSERQHSGTRASPVPGVRIAVLDTGADVLHPDLDDLDFRQWSLLPGSPKIGREPAQLQQRPMPAGRGGRPRSRHARRRHRGRHRRGNAGGGRRRHVRRHRARRDARRRQGARRCRRRAEQRPARWRM